MLGQIQLVGSKFGIFGGFGWVRSSALVDEPGFGKVRSSGLLDLRLDSAHFRLNKFEVQAFWWGSNGFKVRVWRTNLGSKEFKVRHVKFEAVRSSLYLGSIQH